MQVQSNEHLLEESVFCGEGGANCIAPKQGHLVKNIHASMQSWKSTPFVTGGQTVKLLNGKTTGPRNFVEVIVVISQRTPALTFLLRRTPSCSRFITMQHDVSAPASLELKCKCRTSNGRNNIAREEL